MLFEQAVSCLAGFAKHNLFIDAVVRSVSVAFDNAYASAGLERPAQIAQQNNRLGTS